MPARFTVLGSGSSGNASFLEDEGYGLLIDCGLGPRVLAWRLAAIGRSWKSVSAVLISHTHGDHWNALTLAHLRALKVPVYVHASHHDFLSSYDVFHSLHDAGLTHPFASNALLPIAASLTCLPIEVPHDSELTFAFRFDGFDGSADSVWSLGHASDVGHITGSLAALLSGVDTLALEFNHDVRMQRTSGRPKLLIDRVLGKYGHLSNEEAAEFTVALARAAGATGLRHVIQLHLSRECNTPELAARAGTRAVQEHAPDAVVLTSSQFEPTTPILLVGRARSPQVTTHFGQVRSGVQPVLPGL